MKLIKLFLINILLLIVSIVLLILFLGSGFSTAIVAIIFTPANTNYFREVALCLDITGNIVCQYLLRLLMINSKSKYRFGIVGETISSVLGKNELDSTLTYIGKATAKILDFLDKDHCKRSIDYRFTE